MKLMKTTLFQLLLLEQEPFVLSQGIFQELAHWALSIQLAHFQMFQSQELLYEAEVHLLPERKTPTRVTLQDLTEILLMEEAPLSRDFLMLKPFLLKVDTIERDQESLVLSTL